MSPAAVLVLVSAWLVAADLALGGQDPAPPRAQPLSGGRGGGGGGPLDNMRSLEHYLPEHGNQRGQGEDPSLAF